MLNLQSGIAKLDFATCGGSMRLWKMVKVRDYDQGVDVIGHGPHTIAKPCMILRGC